MTLHPAIFLTIVLSVTACSGGGGDSGGGDDSDSSSVASSGSQQSSDDDDLEVADTVPMALVGDEYLASVDSSTPATVKGDGAGAALTGSDAATDIISAPGRATGEMLRLTGDVRSLLAALFGKDGVFHAESVPVPAYGRSRRFALTAAPGGFEYVDIHLNAPDAKLRYGIDLYRRQDDSTLTRDMNIEFSPNADDASKATIHLVQRVTLGSGDVQHVEISYDSYTQWIETRFGKQRAQATEPSHSLIRLALDSDGKSLNVFGAYDWNRTGSPAVFQPQYYVPTTETELFRTRARVSGLGEAFQDLAFYPAAARQANGNAPGVAVFQDYSYTKYADDFLVELLRSSDKNTGCATTGQAFRDATGATPPASVASLPANVCSANASLTNGQLLTAVDDLCGVAPGFQLAAAGAVYQLCYFNEERSLLANSQLLYSSGGNRYLVQNDADKTAEHDKLLSEKATLGFFDFGALSTAWPEQVVAPLAEFAASEVR